MHAARIQYYQSSAKLTNKCKLNVTEGVKKKRQSTYSNGGEVKIEKMQLGLCVWGGRGVSEWGWGRVRKLPGIEGDVQGLQNDIA